LVTLAQTWIIQNGDSLEQYISIASFVTFWYWQCVINVFYVSENSLLYCLHVSYQKASFSATSMSTECAVTTISQSVWKLVLKVQGVCGRMVKFLDFKPRNSSLLWVRIPKGTLDSSKCGSYPASLWNIGGSTQVPICTWNNALKGTWGLPPPVKLEHMTCTVSVWLKPNQIIKLKSTIIAVYLHINHIK
jgi:hypothetical protein